MVQSAGVPNLLGVRHDGPEQVRESGASCRDGIATLTHQNQRDGLLGGDLCCAPALPPALCEAGLLAPPPRAFRTLGR